MYTIYGYLPAIQKCINCDSAKRLCTVKQKEFEFVSIADETDENGPIFNEDFAIMLEKMGRTKAAGLSLPVVFHDGAHIGGFNELRKHIASSK